jgi:tetratricopeptide (TPR) repeat protein
MRASSIALALCCTCLAPLHAEDNRRTANDARARAHAAFDRGRQLFALTQYDKALAEFAEAYKLIEEPAFIFNIAQCERRLGHEDAALKAYRSYLSLTDEHSANHAEVQGYVRELEKSIADKRTGEERSRRLSEERAVEEARAARERVELERLQVQRSLSRTSARRVRAFIVSGSVLGVVGLGLLGAGVATALGMSSARDSLRREASAEAVFDSSIERSYNRDLTLSAAFFSIGGAVAVTGAALLGRGLVERRFESAR